MKINPNDPANPSIESVNHANGIIEIRTNDFGLTIRAELASRAMVGILNSWRPDVSMPPKNVALEALCYADALIEELNREP